MSLCKRLVSLCLCLAMLAAFLLIPVQSASAFAGVKGPTLVKQNGIWYYVKNGAVCKDTTLVKYSGSWYYVKNGTVQSSLTSLVKYNGEWWYVVNGKVASNTTSLVKYNGEWWYVVKGKIASNTTTLIKYNNEWWYVVKGKIAGNTTNLIKYNGEWFYVVKGKVAGNTTTLINYNGGWYYIHKGKLAAKTTTLVQYNGKWYYVENGKVNFGATTLCKYNGAWYYVKNGVYNTMTGFCTYGGQKYYVKNGIAQTSLSGKVTVNGSTYFLKNGVLTNCHTAGHSLQNGVCTRCGYGTPTAVTKLTLNVWGSHNQVDSGWLADMEKAFEKAHPEYNITWVNSICNEGDTLSVMSANSHNTPDVYMYANDQMGSLIDMGVLSDLGGTYLNQVKNDNSQTMVGTVTYTDGKVYGFPVSNNTWFMYYNKDVFSSEDVKSLDTMLTKGKVGFPWTDGWYSGTFFLANGCTLFGSQGNDASAGIQFGGTQGYEAANKMVQLAKNPNFISIGSSDAGLLAYGVVDAAFSGSWDYNALKNHMGDKLGVVMLPKVEIGGVQKQMKSFAGAKVIGVNPDAANKTAAMQFAAYLATPAAQKALYLKTSQIPAAKSLVSDADIKNDPVALAEINTVTNAAVVQPIIPEIKSFWSPMGKFGEQIVKDEIDGSNYKQAVEQLVRKVSGEGVITLRFHYNRPNGDYEGWNLWAWDNDGLSEVDPPFDFVEENGEMVATVQVMAGTQKVGYIIRLREWVDRDIDYDQFVDITGILEGTVDVYVQSGVPGGEVVTGDDVKYGVIVVTATYRAENMDGKPEIAVRMSRKVEDTLSVSVNGQSIPVTKVKMVGSYQRLELGQTIPAGATYTITYQNRNYNFTVPA